MLIAFGWRPVNDVDQPILQPTRTERIYDVGDKRGGAFIHSGEVLGTRV